MRFQIKLVVAIGLASVSLGTAYADTFGIGDNSFDVDFVTVRHFQSAATSYTPPRDRCCLARSSTRSTTARR